MSEIAPGLPAPRYGVGDTFWVARIETEVTTYPCPDCLGERTWRVTSPAGGEHTVSCPRCGSGYSSIKELPSLRYIRHVGRAALFTVQELEVQSHGWEGDDPGRRISYYSGTQGGSVAHEHEAYATEAEALAVAEIRAAEANARAGAAPEHLTQAEFSGLTYLDAALRSHDESLWNSWWAYRRLREAIEGMLDEPDGLADAIRDELRFEDGTFRAAQQPSCPEPLFAALEALVKRIDETEGAEEMTDYKFAETVLAGPELAAARAALDEYLRRGEKKDGG